MTMSRKYRVITEGGDYEGPITGRIEKRVPLSEAHQGWKEIGKIKVDVFRSDNQEEWNELREHIEHGSD